MAVPDPLKIRHYQAEMRRYQMEAARALARLTHEVSELQADPRDLIAARTAAATLSELISALAALKVADSLHFLAEEG